MSSGSTTDLPPQDLFQSEAGSFGWIREDLGMARKRYSADEIVNKLRQAEVELSKGSTVAQMCKQIGVTDQMYY